MMHVNGTAFTHWISIPESGEAALRKELGENFRLHAYELAKGMTTVVAHVNLPTEVLKTAQSEGFVLKFGVL